MTQANIHLIEFIHHWVIILLQSQYIPVCSLYVSLTICFSAFFYTQDLTVVGKGSSFQIICHYALNSMQGYTDSLQCTDACRNFSSQIVELDHEHDGKMTTTGILLFGCNLTCYLYNILAYDSGVAFIEEAALAHTNVTPQALDYLQAF